MSIICPSRLCPASQAPALDEMESSIKVVVFFLVMSSKRDDVVDDPDRDVMVSGDPSVDCCSGGRAAVLTDNGASVKGWLTVGLVGMKVTSPVPVEACEPMTSVVPELDVEDCPSLVAVVP